jgi:hypothetical protein
VNVRKLGYPAANAACYLRRADKAVNSENVLTAATRRRFESADMCAHSKNTQDRQLRPKSDNFQQDEN